MTNQTSTTATAPTTAAKLHPIESITRKADKFFVVTRTFMSDGTFQRGLCELRKGGTELYFPGQMNLLPFRIALGLSSRAIVADLRDGETSYPII